MLDRKYILENLAAVKQNCANRNVTVDVDQMIDLEEQRRGLLQQVQDLNRQANETQAKIKKASNEERPGIIEQGRKLREQKDDTQKQHDELDAQIEVIQRQIPNMAHADAPIGVDDKANLELRRGKHEPPKFDFQPLDHVELGLKHDLIDFEGGARVAGNGFYFLKNEAVLLELALQRYALDLLLAEGFTPTITPDLARTEILQGIGFAPRGGAIAMVEAGETSLGGRLPINVSGAIPATRSSSRGARRCSRPARSSASAAWAAGSPTPT